MGKKVAAATVDDVGACKADVESQIAQAKAALERSFAAQLSAAKKQLEESTEKVRERVEAIDESKLGNEVRFTITEEMQAHVGATAGDLRNELKGLRSEIKDDIEQASEEVEQKAAEGDETIRTLVMEELEKLCNQFDELVSTTREDLERQVKESAAEGARNTAKVAGPLEAAIERARAEAVEGLAEVTRLSNEALENFRGEQDERDKKQDLKSKRIQSDNDIKFLDIEAKLQASSDEGSTSLIVALEKADQVQAEWNDAVTSRFEGLDHELMRLLAICNDVENVPTRKVEWVIKSADTRLAPPGSKRKEGSKKEPRPASGP